MRIHNIENLSDYGIGYLFLDTSALIAITSYFSEFSSVLHTLKDNGRALLTIPSIAFEFSRTENIENYNLRATFLKEYINIYPIEEHLSAFTPLIPVLQKTHGGLSYSDFLLYACLYQFHNSILLTENHKDFTPTLLDRKTVLTVDREDDKQIRNLALYSFSMSKYNNVATKILNNK